ncbi:oligosaccharyl transferase, archaeosortase A system-associated [Natranaeroarchaeum aerophilus]|uniref:dolichyl-phosphooligosaccharide-protein glycotransferase n=1 Tax=Natranaeroarchaeum aerophilus TaxID=2917711 RepID=A0AAE3FRR9_9EURY|nr:oligosaccharyl transferase, archaeosortase A system-associated [Natranaeroarchaeum aerophilus]MCL9813991.1 oligosaccharyl transferase, archaeosortase A system-associated [Natranaeroarchaeum aerophilus]
MSLDTDRFNLGDSESAEELLQQWYHVPALGVLLLFMFLVRIQPYGNFVRDDQVYFSGNDAYYHFRETMYVVENYPMTMPFDPWTRFPFGTSADQFGTLFDQLIATAILIVGLGSPTERQAGIVFVLAPAVFGVLCALPTYFIAKRLSGRLGGVFAVLILALLPGMFLTRSTVGFTDHHVAEVLFQATTILAMMIALTVAEREKPVYEQFLDRDWDGLDTTLKWSGLAGFSLAVYLWTWPPAVILIGILGAFFAVALCIEYVQGRSPEHIAIVGAVSLTVGAVLSLPAVDEFAITSPSTMSLLQPVVALSVAAGCVFMAWLARQWDTREINTTGYPIAVGGLVVLAVAVVAVALPSLFDTVWSQVQSQLLLGQSDTALTISEAQPTAEQPGGASGYLIDNYAFTYIFAIIALVWMVWQLLDASRFRAEVLLVVVWTIFLTLMALTQIRYHYYLAVAVAVLNGWILVQAFTLLEIPSTDQLSDVETYQVIAIVTIVLVIVFPLATGALGLSAVGQANQQHPGAVEYWDDTFDWMEGDTPEPGTFGDADEEMEYYGTYDRTDDFEYPDGAYGVMSWWDYGHWITVEGERIPTANPFQQGTDTASGFFQAQSEERADLLVEALPASERHDGTIAEMDDDELREIRDDRTDQETGEDVRYVTIDDQMAGSKFGAITQWAAAPDVDGGSVQVASDEYYDSMLGSLYYDDAQGMEGYRLVHESESFSAVGVVPSGDDEAVWAEIPAWAPSWEQVPQIEQQLAQLGYEVGEDTQIVSSVKTYERVEGATITGDAEPGETVVVAVPLEANSDRPFTYTQSVEADEDGSFEVTVPYATDNQLDTEDGYTDSAVTATDEYTVIAGEDVSAEAVAEAPIDGGQIDLSAFDEDVRVTGSTDVPEPAIYDGDERPVEFEQG